MKTGDRNIIEGVRVKNEHRNVENRLEGVNGLLMRKNGQPFQRGRAGGMGLTETSTGRQRKEVRAENGNQKSCRGTQKRDWVLT